MAIDPNFYCVEPSCGEIAERVTKASYPRTQSLEYACSTAKRKFRAGETGEMIVSRGLGIEAYVYRQTPGAEIVVERVESSNG